MELPIFKFPTYVEELSEPFHSLFKQKRQLLQFKRLITGFGIAEKHTIAHMNGLFTNHTNQSNLNRFITNSNWDQSEMNRIKICMINKIERDGILILDDYIVEKYGKEIYGTNWHRDHASGRNVWGHQIADCVYSKNGIYPLLSTMYIKKKSKWLKDKFKTKIQIQMDHLTELKEMGLEFSTVVGDSWYYSKDLTDQIKQLEKDWIFQSKSNRLIMSNRKWTPLSKFAEKIINKKKFRVVFIGDDKYFMKVFSVRMKGMGLVRLLITMNKHGNFNFYISNRLDWKEVDIARQYAKRWDIEVWHRDGKGNYGLKECQLRSDEAVKKYITLSTLAATLLEIASLLSPVYAALTKRGRTPEMKHRWVITELVGQLITAATKVGNNMVKKIMEGILTPYKSTINKRITDY